MVAAIAPERCNCIHECAAKQHKVSTADQCLDNIEAGLDAAINNQRDIIPHRSPHRWQSFQRMRRGIKLAAAMIRQHQPVNAHANCAHGVLTIQNSFQHHLARPGRPYVLQIVPVKGAIKLLADEACDWQIAMPVSIRGHVSEFRPTHRRHAQGPARMQRRLPDHTG